MQNLFVKMLTYSTLVLLSLLNIISASPLYHQIGKYSNIKIDPLLASASNDVPMVQSNNFETIMADDTRAHEILHYQNFDNFYEPQMSEGVDFNMDESSHFLPKNTPPRAPQPLSKKEREIRQQVEVADPILEKRKMLKLKKGSTVPRGPDAYPWEQFDYDLFSVDPANQKSG